MILKNNFFFDNYEKIFLTSYNNLTFSNKNEFFKKKNSFYLKYFNNYFYLFVNKNELNDVKNQVEFSKNFLIYSINSYYNSDDKSTINPKIPKQYKLSYKILLEIYKDFAEHKIFFKKFQNTT